MRSFSLLILLLLSLQTWAFQTETDSTATNSQWTLYGKASFLFSQTAFSNWTSGGENNLSGTLLTDYNFDYDWQGWSWDTKLQIQFGLNKTSGSDYLKKTTDRFEINSVLAKQFMKTLNYSTIFNFKTQLANGFKYYKNQSGEEQRTRQTHFFSPAYLQLGVGVYWKESKHLWANLAPMAGRLILVNSAFTRDLQEGKEYFGVKKGENHRFELGASFSGYYKFDLMQNVTLEHQLSLYSDYLDHPENIDLDYTISAEIRANKYLTTNLIFQTRYDHNAIAAIQLREVFGLGVTLSL